jgi:hypothetical protein
VCDKEYIYEAPKWYFVSEHNKIKDPDPNTDPDDLGFGKVEKIKMPGHIFKSSDVPDNFFELLYGTYYHIYACGGCSIDKNINVNPWIASCVYQLYDNKYTYCSDSIDPKFEEYARKNGIKIGMPVMVDGMKGTE